MRAPLTGRLRLVEGLSLLLRGLMRFELKPHLTTPPDVGVEVHAVNRAGLVRLSYRLQGGLSGIVIPPVAPPVRTDELWRSTCFELFVRGRGTSYREFNFSPSGAWAAYRFDAHREGMRAAQLDDPEIRWADATLEVSLPLELEGNEPVGLSAILERADGTRLFYALAHPPGEPDFHHEACFAATLPPIEQA